MARELGAVAAALVVFACGRVKDHEPSKAPIAIDAELCHFLERCHPELFALFAGGSLDACLAWASCSDVAQDWSKTLTDAQGCVAFVRGATCDEMPVAWYGGFGAPLSVDALSFDAGSACTRPKPTLPAPAPDGGACLTSEEGSCRTGSYCAISSAEQLVGTGYCGSCSPRVPDGTACTDTTICVNGDRCVSGRCRATSSAGVACFEDVECSSWNCANGYCIDPPAPSQGSIQRDDALLGQPCDIFQNPCLETPFTACVGGVCVPRPDLGDACDSAGECRVGAVCAGGICIAQECVATAGEPCGQSCERGTACDFDTSLCTPLPGLGEPCTTECASPYRCSLTDGVCVRWRKNGEPCRQSLDCASSFCDRDYSAYCTPTGCDIPSCDTDCGVCADEPTRRACE